jgi:acetolactate synthase-1/2/3 large subunit
MNHSPMGYSLPGSIGASLATNRRVIVIIGDGSLMMNIHDLQTIKDLNRDIKIIIINNGGYGMLRQTQNDWKEFLTQGVASDFNIPNIKDLSKAFGINFCNYKKAMKCKGPTISEIKIKDTTISPKWKWGEKL